MTTGSAGKPVWIRDVGAGIKGFLRQVESCQRKPFPGLTYSSIPCWLINIHQRTKTRGGVFVRHDSISLSISIREPKRGRPNKRKSDSISLSISIREPKPSETESVEGSSISLSISIREPKQITAIVKEDQSISLSISIREPKQHRDRPALAVRISLSISIREPKLPD